MGSRKSNSVRAGDVAALLELSHETASLPHDPAVRRRHILAGLCRLVGARAGCTAYYPFGSTRPVLGAPPVPAQTRPVLFGFDGDEVRRVEEYLDRPHSRDPTITHLERVPGPYCANVREQFIPDRAWYGCDHYDGLLRHINVDAQIYCRVPSPGRRLLTIALCRPVKGRLFSRREITLVDLCGRPRR